ncbi:hypothetical protein BJV77DRAFT_966018 [Russula vinacea]|nr:hypothetical protein BJV77DRAFT_966018 [Russula vinacea]
MSSLKTTTTRLLGSGPRESPPNADKEISRSILRGGVERVLSYGGTGQYSRDGTGASACGLAALNFARIVFSMEQSGLQGTDLLQAVLTRECAEETISICGLWSSNLHLEVEDICRVPLFEKTLELKKTNYGHPGVSEFKTLLTEMSDLDSSAVAIITRPPEIIACLKLRLAFRNVFIIFDSHPRPSYPNGAGMIANTSIEGTARRLAEILPNVDLSDGILQWQAQLLSVYSGHVFVPQGVEKSTPTLWQTILEFSLAQLSMRAEISELRSQNVSLKNEQQRLESKIKEEEARSQPSPAQLSMQAEISKLRAEISELRSQNVSLKNGQQRLETEIKEVEARSRRQQTQTLFQQQQQQQFGSSSGPPNTAASTLLAQISNPLPNQVRVAHLVTLLAHRLHTLAAKMINFMRYGACSTNMITKTVRSLISHPPPNQARVAHLVTLVVLLAYQLHPLTAMIVFYMRCACSTNTTTKTMRSLISHPPPNQARVAHLVTLVALLAHCRLHRRSTSDRDDSLLYAMRLQHEFDKEDRVLSAERAELSKFSQRLFECGVCMEEMPYDSVARPDPCGHTFCRDCLRGHVTARLDEHKSKGKGVDGEVSQSLALNLGLTDKQYRIWTEIEMNAFSVPLNCRKCKRTMFVARDEYDAVDIIVCPLPNCDHAWCKQCQQSIDFDGPEHSCDGTLELDHLIKKKGWNIARKESGCNHMTCLTPACNTHFCYICGGLIVNQIRPKR